MGLRVVCFALVMAFLWTATLSAQETDLASLRAKVAGASLEALKTLAAEHPAGSLLGLWAASLEARDYLQGLSERTDGYLRHKKGRWFLEVDAKDRLYDLGCAIENASWTAEAHFSIPALAWRARRDAAEWVKSIRTFQMVDRLRPDRLSEAREAMKALVEAVIHQKIDPLIESVEKSILAPPARIPLAEDPSYDDCPFRW